MRYFDAHCHPQMEQYDADRAEVLARMKDLDMGGLVVGTDYEISKKGIELAGQYDFLWATVGSHPNHPENFDFFKFEELAQNKKVVAIGECGLDYFRSQKPGDQVEKFKAHVELAEKLQKPLIVHCREAHDDCSQILENMRISVPVVMHFFTGSGELAQKYLNLGCYLSFPGPVTFTEMYDDSIRLAPLDNILSETDSPFAAPAPYRGKRNEPAYTVEVVRKIAAIKGLSVDDMGAQIVTNAARLFGLQK
jgi:TatD DNase family protein